MPSLVLRFAGPMQSWGDHTALRARRPTAHQPTKSGVIGLVCAALGHDRTQPLGDLATLRLGVRVDQPGTLLADYRTTSDYRGRPLPSSKVNAKGVQTPTTPPIYSQVSHRFYLTDAVLIAVLEAAPELLDRIHNAIRQPHYALSLGRRGCAPVGPITLGTRPTGLLETLHAEPWHARPHHVRRHTADAIQLPVTYDDPTGHTVLQDQPVSFDPHNRQHTSRTVTNTHMTIPTGHTPRPDQTRHVHDPLSLLGW